MLNEFIIPTTAFYPPPTVNTPELPTEDKESTGMDEKVSQGGPLTGPNSLPIRGQRGAPTKFTGRYDAVVTFLQHYERLCIKHSVVSDLDKVECITQYCSRAVKEFMEGLSSFQERSWSAFKFDILKYFDAERDAGRHLVSDLERYVLRSRTRKMRDLSTWKAYNRAFIRIAGWLVNTGKLQSRDQDLYFWKGIQRDFRNRLEIRLHSIHPSHDLSVPWPRDYICKVAEALLQRDKFEKDRLPTDSEPESGADPEEDRVEN